MYSKSRIAVNQLSAVAKKFNSISTAANRQRKSRFFEGGATYLFAQEFVKSFFPLKDAWIGKSFFKMLKTRTGYLTFLNEMRSRLRRMGVRSAKERDAIIEQKMRRTLRKIDFILKTLLKQRQKMEQTEVGEAYHGVKNIFTGMKGPAKRILKQLANEK